MSTLAGRRDWGVPLALSLVGVLLAASLGASAASPGLTSTASSATVSPLQDAERSLASGNGPSAGAPWTCQGTGSGASCATTAVPLPGRSWTNLTATLPTAPSPRYHAAITYDQADGYVLLFGGFPSNQETWTFQDGHWTQLLIAGPPSRQGAAICYDVADGYVLMFGGLGGVNNNIDLNDTWKYLDGTWTNLTPYLSASPPARRGAGMTYDAADGEVILFAGTGTNGLLGDTWAYSRGRWSLVPTAHSPLEMAGVNMVYDPALDGVLLFGGQTDTQTYNETWLYRHGNWSALSPPGPVPHARAYTTLVYDPGDGAVLLFGGAYENTEIYFNDTWMFAQGRWTNLTAYLPQAPSPRESPNLAWNPANGTMILFGGHHGGTLYDGDTWSFGGGALNVSAYADRGLVDATQQAAILEAGATGGTPPYNYSWTFGDGGSAYGALVGHAYARPGVYTAVLTVHDAVPTTLTVEVSVAVRPALDVGRPVSSPDPVTPGRATNLSLPVSGGSGVYNISWTALPPGCTGGNATSISCTPTGEGTFWMNASVADSLGEELAVSGAMNVSYLAGTPSASRSLLDVGQSTQLGLAPAGGTGVYRIAWKGLPTGCASANASVLPCAPTAPGTFGVRAFVNDTLGATTETPAVQITVDPELALSARVSASELPAPADLIVGGVATGGTGPLSIVWTFGDGSTLDSLNTSHTYSHAGTYRASVFVNDSVGETVNATYVLVVVLPLAAQISFSANGTRPGSPVTVSVATSGGGAIEGYAWTLDGSNYTGSSAAFFPYNASAAGNYTFSVSVSDALGEVAHARATLEVLPALGEAKPVAGTAPDRVDGAIALGILLLVGIVLVVLLWRRRSAPRPNAPSPTSTAAAPPTSSPAATGRKLPPWPMHPMTAVETAEPGVLWQMAASSGVDRQKILLITPDLPARVSAAYGLAGAATFRLARAEGEGNVSPADVDRLGYLIETHLGKETGRAVVLDGLEKIVDAASLKNAKRLLAVVSEVATTTRGAFLYSLHPTLLEPAERRQLEEGSTVVRPEEGSVPPPPATPPAR